MLPFFVKSSTNENDWIKDSKKEIAFVGRSNVGKSSLINALAKAKIARTSNTPGRTRLVNFFDFGNFRLVDLPGYGYAKIAKSEKFEISKILSKYLYKRENIVSIFQLCDVSVLTDQDKEISKTLNEKFSNHFIVLNKIDKVNKSFFNNNVHKYENFLELSREKIIPVSAKDKIGIDILNKIIKDIVGN